jgi:hypothetical protein
MKINRYDKDLPKAERSLGIFEGCLWRAKSPETPFTQEVLRENYCLTHQEIDTVADLKATIRAGKYAWPGLYPMYFITSDGAALSFEAVEQEFSQVAYAVRHKLNDGWRVVGCDINYEDNELVCAHTGEPIESAYGED